MEEEVDVMTVEEEHNDRPFPVEGDNSTSANDDADIYDFMNRAVSLQILLE